MKRQHVRAVVVAGVIAVAATGCIKADVQLELQSDDTVDGTMILAFSKELTDLMGEEADSMQEEMLNGAMEDMPEGATAEEYEDEEFIGTRYTFEGAPLDDFDEGDDMSITHDGDEFVVSGVMDMSTGDSDELGLGGLGGMTNAEVVLAITFPGEVLEHDGELKGTTVTWRPALGEQVEINARARDSGGSGLPAWLWAVIGVLAVAAIIGGIFWFSRRKQNTEAYAEQTPEVPMDAAPAETTVDGPGTATSDVPPPSRGDTRELPRPDEPPAPEPR